jgi:hypothetical protein
MTTKNIFIPKRLLPDRFDLIVESFEMRELMEVDSKEGWTNFLESLKMWASLPGHHVFGHDFYLGQIPLFMVEIIVRDANDRKLCVRMLTNRDLFEFLMMHDELANWRELAEVMELKGVPL